MQIDQDGLQRRLQETVRTSYRSLTFITTYRCTAACADCCFECSPQLPSPMLDSAFMKERIDEALMSLPALALVVFSGGECYMLKEHLYDTIEHATAKGLSTRTVTNGYWGKSRKSSARIAGKVAAAGLKEVNISTGLDHQRWVPLDSVINAAEALLEQGIPTLVTVEKDAPDSNCWKAATSHSRAQGLLRDSQGRFKLVCNSWMPFKTDSVSRNRDTAEREETGCKQLFGNLVITPHQVVSACCGLTFEHIPEMRLGAAGAVPLQTYVEEMALDFLKIWIHVDGPREVARRILAEKRHDGIEEAVHMCEACAILHQDPEIRSALMERCSEFMPDVVQRYLVGEMLSGMARPMPRRIPLKAAVASAQ